MHNVSKIALFLLPIFKSRLERRQSTLISVMLRNLRKNVIPFQVSIVICLYVFGQSISKLVDKLILAGGIHHSLFNWAFFRTPEIIIEAFTLRFRWHTLVWSADLPSVIPEQGRRWRDVCLHSVTPEIQLQQMEFLIVSKKFVVPKTMRVKLHIFEHPLKVQKAKFLTRIDLLMPCIHGWFRKWENMRLLSHFASTNTPGKPKGRQAHTFTHGFCPVGGGGVRPGQAVQPRWGRELGCPQQWW